MTDYRGGEWTEETQSEFERLYAIYDDGDRDKIFALLFEEKLALELHAELDKKAIRSLENKIDMMEAEIEGLLRALELTENPEPPDPGPIPLKNQWRP